MRITNNGLLAGTLNERDALARRLTENGFGSSKRMETQAALNALLVFSSVAADVYEGRLALVLLEALQGRALLRTDRNAWVEITLAR